MFGKKLAVVPFGPPANRVRLLKYKTNIAQTSSETMGKTTAAKQKNLTLIQKNTAANNI